MTHPAPAPPYPRSGPEGTHPVPAGVPIGRLAASALAVPVAGVLVLVADGLGTTYRIPALAPWSAVPVVLVGALLALTVLRRAALWARVLLVALALAVALGTQLVAVGSRPEVLASATSPGGDVRAGLVVPRIYGVIAYPDALAVRVEHPGLVAEDLAWFCVDGTSGPPRRASIRWVDDDTFVVRMPQGYGYGPWRFDVARDRVTAVSSRTMDAC